MKNESKGGDIVDVLGGGGYSHTWDLGLVGWFHSDDPRFGDFQSKMRLNPCFMPHHDSIDPLFCRKKISLSLSHLVTETLGPKIGLIFHLNVLFNSF